MSQHKALRLAHIVNPVVVKPTSDLFVAQPVVFESMRIAKAIALEYGIEVNQYSAQFKEDRDLAGQYLLATDNLERSILDLGSFKISRKLPLISDILDRLYASDQDSEYLIYTNVDITLMPYFYVVIGKLIQEGKDAFVVNRRTISEKYKSPDDLSLMYAQVGKAHWGHDCFVFKRSAYPQYYLANVCIGVSLIGVAMLINLICNSQEFKEYRHLHLTFHLGDELSWRSPTLDDYTHHNLSEVEKIVRHYQENQALVSHPLIQKFLDNRDIEYWTNRQTVHKSKVFAEVIPRIKNKVRRFFL